MQQKYGDFIVIYLIKPPLTLERRKWTATQWCLSLELNPEYNFQWIWFVHPHYYSESNATVISATFSWCLDAVIIIIIDIITIMLLTLLTKYRIKENISENQGKG